MNKDYTKNGIKGLVAVLIYFYVSFFSKNILTFIGFNVNDMSNTNKTFVSISLDVILVVILFFIFRKQLQSMWQDLKKNNKLYFKKYFKLWFLLIAVIGVSNLIISFIKGGDIAGNEQAIRTMFDSVPILTYIMAVLLAPFIEEVIFRLGFRNIFKSNLLFIIISGLVFGGLHVISYYSGPTDLLYLIPYCTPGFIFAYIMVKTNNVFVSMGIHCFHNGITLALQIIVLLFS